MSGASLWHAYLNLCTEIDRLPLATNAVLLVCAFGGNDLDEPYGAIRTRAELPWASALDRMLREVKTFVAKRRLVVLARRAMRSPQLSVRPEAERDFVLPRPLGDGKIMLFYSAYEKVRHRTAAEIAQHEHYAPFTNTVRAIADLAAAHGLRLVVVSFPSKEEVYAGVLDGSSSGDTWKPSAFTVALHDLCDAGGVSFIDPGTALRSAAAGGAPPTWWLDDSHMNARGNDVAATAILDALAAQPAERSLRR